MIDIIILSIILVFVIISWYYVIRPEIQISHTGIVTLHWSSYNANNNSMYRKYKYIMTIENETILNWIDKWKNKKLPY